MPFELHNPFKKQESQYNPAAESYAQALLNSASAPSANEEQSMRELEINIHTIKDESLVRKLEQLSITPEKKYVIPAYDENGKRKAMDDTITIPAQPVPWALAASVAVSKVFASRFITNYDAVTYKNRIRNEFLKIKRNMSREDRYLFGSFLNEIELYALTAIDDSVNGQKMLSLKTSGRHLRVGVSTGQQSQK